MKQCVTILLLAFATLLFSLGVILMLADSKDNMNKEDIVELESIKPLSPDLEIEGIIYLKEYKISKNETRGIICEQSVYDEADALEILREETPTSRMYAKVLDDGTILHKCILFKQPSKENPSEQLRI